MKFTISWLKDHLETHASLPEICEALTRVGLEVESIDDRALFKPFLIAQIIDAKPHPQADKLQVCTVNNGCENLQIVCGAPNARKDLKVVLAPIGTYIPANDFTIKAAQIRGVDSNGMLCSSAELGLGEDADGIMELPEDAPVGHYYAPYAGLDDPVIEIAITPNRGDCLGVRGIARDLAACGLGTLKPAATPDIAGQGDSKVKVQLSTEHCPYFIGRSFSGLKNGPSPAWMQQRLESIGLNPVSALVDITNYVSYTYNRPLHVYDISKLSGDLQVRLSTKGEKLQTLQHKECVLPDSVCVIADEKEVQAIGGVIGAEESGCIETTTDAFLEIAYFNPDHVASSGRTLGIHTDSRYRFERNVDPHFMKEAAALTTQLILDCCGGQASDLLEAGDYTKRDKTISFDLAKIKSIGGMEVDKDQALHILAELGFTVSNSNISPLEVSVPTWRPDINEAVDLVEEIARVHGYQHIQLEPLPAVANQNQPVQTPQQNRQWLLRRLMAGRGLTEIITYSFMSSQKAQLFHPVADELRLMNPISAELDVMRETIIPNLLDAVLRNHNRGFGNLALFEVGPVFSSSDIGNQSTVIAGVRSGLHHRQVPQQSARQVDLFDAKADLFAALSSAGLPVENVMITREAPSWYHPGRSGAVKLGKNILGYFGELHPATLQAYDIPVKVVGYEFLVDNLPPPKVKASKSKPKIQLSEFQKVERDFAFIVDEHLPADKLVKAVRAVDKQLITEVILFDVYQGKGIDEGKKSIAFSVTLTPTKKTLTDAEIQETSNAIINQVTKQCAGVLRG